MCNFFIPFSVWCLLHILVRFVLYGFRFGWVHILPDDMNRKIKLLSATNKENAFIHTKCILYIRKNEISISQRPRQTKKDRNAFLVGRIYWTCAVNSVSDCLSGNKSDIYNIQPTTTSKRQQQQHATASSAPTETASTYYTGRLKFIDGNCNPHIR